MTRPFSSIPDGHGTVTLYRHVERGDSTVVAVRRDTPADPQHLAAPPALDPDVYDLLAAVADPGEQVVERVVERYAKAHQIHAEWGQLSRCSCGDDLEDVWTHDVRAVLAALREVTRG